MPVNTVDRTVGLNLRRAREAADLTQGALAARCGLAATVIAAAERGQGRLGAEAILALCRGLQITPGALLQGKPPGACQVYPFAPRPGGNGRI